MTRPHSTASLAGSRLAISSTIRCRRESCIGVLRAQARPPQVICQLPDVSVAEHGQVRAGAVPVVKLRGVWLPSPRDLLVPGEVGRSVEVAFVDEYQVHLPRVCLAWQVYRPHAPGEGPDGPGQHVG